MGNGIDSYAFDHHRTGQKQFRPVFTKTVSFDQVFSPNDSAAESSNKIEVGYQNDVHCGSDSDCPFQPPDNDEILDWDAPVLEKPFIKSAFINFESPEVVDQPPTKRLRLARSVGNKLLDPN